MKYSDVIKKSKCLSIFYLYYRKFSSRKISLKQREYKLELLNRSKTNIFNYKKLSRELKVDHVYPLFLENLYYGNENSIKKIITQKMGGIYLIEHGYYFGEYLPEYSFAYNGIVIITFSMRRVQHMESIIKKSDLKHPLNVVTIGPYINYADSIIDQVEMKKIKEDYGKILLVFPSHSIEGVIYKYNTQDFINEIEKVSKDFDSVFVCMYWKDIQDGRYVEYEKKGYKIVTAGHRNDTNFLGRLKDIIDLSDMTMSNTVGTHVGYCVARNKPHYLFNQFQEVEGEKADEEFKERKNLEYLRTRDEEVNEVIGAFSKLSYIITEEQKDVVEKYWGKNEVKYYTISKKGIKNDKKNL